MTTLTTFQYARFSDNVAPNATITASAEDTAYPSTWLVDNLADQPGKLTTTSGNWVFDFGSPQVLACATLIQHNLSAGLDVRLEGNATNTWGAPTLSDSFTIPARYTDNFTVNVRIMLTDLHAAGARTFRYWRLNIAGTNSANVSIGEVRLDATIRSFGIRNINWDSPRAWRRPAVVHETDRLVRHGYSFGTTVRALQVEAEATATTLDDIEAWFRDVGVTRPFTLIPDANDDDTLMAVMLNADLPHKRSRGPTYPIGISFQETSRGLYP